MRPFVLLVANDSLSCRAIRACLERAGYQVREYFSYDILPDVEILQPALVLIEISSQDNKGFELSRSIRSGRIGLQTRVILITRCGTAPDCSTAFEAGADACVTRPIIPGEFLASIQTVLGSAPVSVADEPAELCFGALHLDLFALRVSICGKPVPTTILEFRLIEYMVRNQGRVFTRDQLLDAVWGEECFVTPRTVDACIRRIRTKMAASRSRPSMLKTIRGIGYCLDDAVDSTSGTGNRSSRTVSRSVQVAPDSFPLGSHA